ncbi:MAG: hypothetical protein U1D30_10955 [Planctomycetota bacterium]
MRTIQVSAELPRDDVLFLANLADEKRCTFEEMLEEAVAQFVAAQRRRTAYLPPQEISVISDSLRLLGPSGI